MRLQKHISGNNESNRFTFTRNNFGLNDINYAQTKRLEEEQRLTFRAFKDLIGGSMIMIFRVSVYACSFMLKCSCDQFGNLNDP